MDILTFKDLTTDDEPDLFRLFVAVRAGELGMHGWVPEQRHRMLQFQFEAQRRGYRDRYAAPVERLILRDGSPVGWVIVDRSGPVFHVVDIAIVSEARGGGIGTRVCRALQEEAAAADRPLALSVLHTNLRALALYLRLGFRVIGEADPYALMEWRRDRTHSTVGDDDGTQGGWR